MNWLVDNPIGNMVGPHFLVFYGSAIVMTLVVCAWWVRSGDRSADRPLMELPKSVAGKSPPGRSRRSCWRRPSCGGPDGRAS